MLLSAAAHSAKRSGWLIALAALGNAAALVVLVVGASDVGSYRWRHVLPLAIPLGLLGAALLVLAHAGSARTTRELVGAVELAAPAPRIGPSVAVALVLLALDTTVTSIGGGEPSKALATVLAVAVVATIAVVRAHVRASSALLTACAIAEKREPLPN